jgi:sugar O-acyltransferase (sialic acid O-acetyltransferase NeuD family)
MSGEPRPLLILGAGAFAVAVSDLVSEIGGYRVTGFVQSVSNEDRPADLDGLPVHWIDDIAALASTHWGLCAVGSPKRQAFIERAGAFGLRFATLVHPLSNVSKRAELGEGTLASPFSAVAALARVGRHVIINRGALLGHHCEIGDYVTIGPGAKLGGGCRVGEKVVVGIGATILDKVEIGPRSFIGAGAVVVKDIPPDVRVLDPASILIEQRDC